MPNGQNVELDQEIPKTKRLLVELENIFRQLEIITERSELIREMDKAILRSTFSPQEVLNLIVEKCLSKTDSQHGQVVQYRHNRLVVVASTETSHVGEELPLHKSLCGKAVIEEATQHSPDVSQIPPDNYVRYHEETKSELAVLIQSEHSARVLGVLNLEREQLGWFDPTSVEFAELLAGQAAIAIRHAQTWSGVKMLYELSTSLLSGNITLEKSYQAILEAILEEFDFEHGQILQLVDNEFVILASSRKEDIGLRPGKHTSVCGQYLLVEQGRNLLVIDDIEHSPYGEFYLALLEEEGRPMRSEMIVPLIENENFIGALNIESPRIGIFTDFERNLIGVIGSLMASALTATFKRASQVSQGRIQAANLALTQLGHVAQSFLHRFGNNIGDARGRLLELKEHLSSSQIPPMRSGRISAADFIADVTEKLTEASIIIDDFSDRFNPSHPRFQLREMDMERVAEIALDRTRSRYANQPIKFHFENLVPTAETGDKEDKRSVCYLSEQVYEVIENLMNNAVEAIMERGEDFKEGRVSVVLEIPDPFHILLRVRDNGVGIAEVDQQRIFEFGYTSRKGRRNRGIGLWFCDLYVKQRGGKINFSSTRGEGTTFEILFPTILAGIKYT
jgi:signal transduction histidine kinase